MQKFAALVVALACSSSVRPEPAPVRPKAGKVQIFKEADLKPGMKGYAWTVLSGTRARTDSDRDPRHSTRINGDPSRTSFSPRWAARAIRTNVAGGMSGSPVYIDGKLVGAVALRFSVFSPDAICGITPIELMLEVNDFDKSRPADARTPGKNRGAGIRPGSQRDAGSGAVGQPAANLGRTPPWCPSRRR